MAVLTAKLTDELTAESEVRTGDAAVHAALAWHAHVTPTAPAFVGLDGSVLDYRSLLTEVRRSARHLRDLGLGVEDRIALSLSNSPAAAIAFLATSSVGVSAPLNPEYRQPEFESYFRALKVNAVLVGDGDSGECRAAARAAGVRVVEVRSLTGSGGRLEFASQDRESGVANDDLPPPGQLALLLHTSGTTSRPKIVPLTHGNIGRSARDIADALALGPSDRSLVVMPLFHIHGLSAVLATLTTGGSLVCPPQFLSSDFLDWLKAFRPTWYTAAPSIHRAACERAEAVPGGLRSTLRFIRSASAPMPAGLARKIEAAFGVPFLEAYGMSEAAPQIASNRPPPTARKAGSVGRPAGPEVRILDANGRTCAPGAHGEIVIRGANVTSGYEGDAAANSAAFVGGWLRTGDEGYLDSDGYLYVSDRISDVINRGGEKISPREVEEVLLQHPRIADAVVFAMPDPRLGQDVAAAVVLRPGLAVTESEIQEFVLGRVAHFKVPRRVVVCDTLPRGGVGKQVRRRLPEILGLDRGAGASLPAVYAAPRNERELGLIALWKSVLNVDELGVDDDFFASGGDSILAARLLARVRESAGVALPLVAMFDATSTVARMAERIAASEKSAEGAIPKLAPDADAPLSFAEEGLWLAEQMDPGHPVYNVYRALRMPPSLDERALGRAVDAIVARHAALRTSYPSGADGRPVRSAAATRPALEVIDAAARGESVEAVAIDTTLAPFQIGVGPLFRARLIRAPGESPVLLVVAHHIVADAWSLQVLLEDLAEYYSADVEQRPANIQPLRLDSADFAAWQREVQSASYGEQVGHWRAHLAGAPALLAMPTDRPRPARRTFRGARRPVQLDAELTARIGAMAQDEKATVFMVLLAAYGVLLAQWTGENDIVIGTHVAGRSVVEVERLVGSFINTLALRLRLGTGITFRQAVRGARGVAMHAYANDAVPFGRLLEALRPARSLSHTPLFQVKLRLQNVPTSALSFGGVEAIPIDLDYGYLKVDLGLELLSRDDGLVGFLEYNTDLFDAPTVDALGASYVTLLDRLLDQPDQSVGALADTANRRGTPMTEDSRPASSPRGARRAVSAGSEALVETGHLEACGPMPLVITPRQSGIRLLEWAAANREWIDAQCAAAGGLLFRGFDVPDVATFEAFAKTCTRTLLEYKNRSTPRSKVSGEVYTSTEFPADQSIPMHNEMSYTLSWPLKIWFHCVTPAIEGGETPFADSALVYQRIPVAVRDRFAEKGVLYVRNFTRSRSQGFDLSWPDTFQTEDPAAVETFCRENAIEWEWLNDGRLRTRQRCQAVAPHYSTGTMLWFNQAHLFHVTSLRPEIRSELLAAFAPADLPRNSYYGDGSEIEAEALDAIRTAYDATAIAFPWQTGDIVMLDNMRVAHGRNPFKGPRKIVVAMAESYSQGSTAG